MQKISEQELIERAFDRASKVEFFIAHDLEIYCKANATDQEDLSRFLECGAQALLKLGLCRRPDSTSPFFRAQVESIARHSGVNAARLGSLLRETEIARSVDTLPPNQRSLTASGSLMAARDRTEPSGKRKPRDAKHRKKNGKKK